MTNILRKQGVNTGGGGGSNTNFLGTRAEWEALTTAQQNTYDTVDFPEEDGGDSERVLLSLTGTGSITYSTFFSGFYSTLAGLTKEELNHVILRYQYGTADCYVYFRLTKAANSAEFTFSTFTQNISACQTVVIKILSSNSTYQEYSVKQNNTVEFVDYSNSVAGTGENYDLCLI